MSAILRLLPYERTPIASNIVFFGLEFWLPLPLLGLTFWVGVLLTDRMLESLLRSYDSAQADTQMEGQPLENGDINQRRN